MDPEAPVKYQADPALAGTEVTHLASVPVLAEAEANPECVPAQLADADTTADPV